MRTKSHFQLYIVGSMSCVTTSLNPNESSKEESTIEICFYNERKIEDPLSRIAYPICLMISNVFLVITFAVYAFLPELRQPLFGKITMIFILSLTFAYSMAATVKFIQ